MDSKRDSGVVADRIRIVLARTRKLTLKDHGGLAITATVDWVQDAICKLVGIP